MRMQLLFIFQSICLLLSFSCTNNNELTLECVLDSYTEIFQKRLGAEITITETKGWTDSTSILSIMTLDRNRLTSGRYWFAEYNGLSIYYSQAELKNGDIDYFMEKQSLIPSNLNWQEVKIKIPDIEDEIVPPEQFDEVQIIYNPSKKCIEESNMMSRIAFKEQIKSNCDFCN